MAGQPTAGPEVLYAQEYQRLIAAFPEEFVLGYVEGVGDVGMTYDGDPESERSVAYDVGRTLRQGMEMGE